MQIILNDREIKILYKSLISQIEEIKDEMNRIKIKDDSFLNEVRILKMRLEPYIE